MYGDMNHPYDYSPYCPKCGKPYTYVGDVPEDAYVTGFEPWCTCQVEKYAPISCPKCKKCNGYGFSYPERMDHIEKGAKIGKSKEKPIQPSAHGKPTIITAGEECDMVKKIKAQSISEELKNKIYALAYYNPKALPDPRLEKMYNEIIDDIEESI